MVGVVDFCDILQPTHNKQEFLVNTVEYRCVECPVCVCVCARARTRARW